jgi:uncharacterized protein (DUF983 family)
MSSRPRFDGALASFRPGPQTLNREGERNDCPECGNSRWLVGRFVAECAVCGTALILSGVLDGQR